MTGRLLDRELSRLFDDGPRHAPAVVVERAIDRATSISQRQARFARLDRRSWPPAPRSIADPAVRRRLRMVAVCVLVLLLAVVFAVGARLLSRPPTVTIVSAGTLGEILRSPSAGLWLDGRILISGDGGTQLLFDPATGASSRLILPPGWTSSSVNVLPDGHVVLIGPAEGTGPIQRAPIGFYDPIANEVAPAGTITMPPFSGSTLVLRDGRILTSGGIVFPASEEPGCSPLVCEGQATPSPSPTSAQTDGERANVAIFDPATGATTELAPMLHPRYHHEMLELLDGRILIVGGMSAQASPSGDVLEVEVYDLRTQTPKVVGMISPGRGPFWLAPTLLTDGRVIIQAGGAVEDPCGPPSPATSVSVVDRDVHLIWRQDLFVFDPVGDRLDRGPILPHWAASGTGRSIIALDDGRAAVIGTYIATPAGCGSEEGAYAQPWLGVIDLGRDVVYESSNPLTGVATLPIDIQRDYQTGVLLADGRLVLVAQGDEQPVENPVDIVTIGP